MAHFTPVKKDKVHIGYLCYKPVKVQRLQEIYLPCQIISFHYIANKILPEEAEISIIGDVFFTVIWEKLEKLYDMEH